MRILNFCLFFLLFNSFSSLNAQINHVLNSDSTIVFDRIYAGVLGYSNHESIQQSTRDGTVRAGAMVSWKLTPKIQARYWSMWESSGLWLNNYWLEYGGDRLSVIIGNNATAFTLEKPHPLSGFGQFIPPALGVIPNSLPGITSAYRFKKASVMTGYYVDNDGLDVMETKLSFWNVRIGGLYRTDKSWATVLTYENDSVRETLFFDKKSDRFSSFTNILFADYSFYHTIVVEDSKLSNGEFGILRLFGAEDDVVKGLIGPGYNYKNRTLNLYLEVTL